MNKVPRCIEVPLLSYLHGMRFPKIHGRRLIMHESCLTLRVRYAETDQMGVAHHGSYFVWMEAARTELLREQGLSYRELEKRGYFLPVREAHCRYRKGLQYDDQLVIKTRVQQLGGASIRIGYSIFQKGSPEVVAEGYTLHACTNADGSVVRTPAFFKNLLSSAEPGMAEADVKPLEGQISAEPGMAEADGKDIS
jgi:acyl-CoA thioester hydrolase